MRIILSQEFEDIQIMENGYVVAEHMNPDETEELGYLNQRVKSTGYGLEFYFESEVDYWGVPYTAMANFVELKVSEGYRLSFRA
jgi:hypothetical protein